MTHSAGKVLVVDESAFFRKVVRQGVEERLGCDVVEASSLSELRSVLTTSSEPFFVALVDLVLNDCDEAENVSLVAQHGIPSIVFTSVYSDSVRRRLQQQQVIDYVVKDSPSSLHHAVDLVERLQRNLSCRVLVVDASPDMRRYLHQLLKCYRFQVTEAATGAEALNTVLGDSDIKLIVTGNELGDMDGVEFVRQVRAVIDYDRVSIIGMSEANDADHSIRFLKYGANDFLTRPFLREEFYCRVLQNVRVMEMISKLRTAATRDHLTELHNRRFLFDAGNKLFASMKRGQISVCCAMIDIDHFKQVNDTYGHEAGDTVLREIAQILAKRFRQTDVVARIGGEEFAILAVNMNPDAVYGCFETLRTAIASTPISLGEQSIYVTASFGITTAPAKSLQEMLDRADQMLYRAKHAGRNRIEIDLIQ